MDVKKTLRGGRLSGLDILKLIAMLFVVVLHINGYTEQLNLLNTYAPTSKAVYWITQAIAYPAIHLFVLIGSYFMVERTVKLKNVLYIYAQTIVVSLVGLAVVALARREAVSVIGVLQCVFPIITKSYWFVSLYILLMLLSPALNLLINRLEDRALYALTGIIFLAVVALPTFLGKFNWTGDSLGLFICLYFIAASMKRGEMAERRRSTYALLWLVSVTALWTSVYAIEKAGAYIGALSGKENLFFHYNSVFVVAAAVGLFGLFRSLRIRSSRAAQLLSKATKYSLVTYLVHMHPVVKTLYTPLRALAYMRVSSGWLYLLQLIATGLCVFIVGELLGAVVTKISGPIADKIHRKFFHNRAILKICRGLMIDTMGALSQGRECVSTIRDNEKMD